MGTGWEGTREEGSEDRACRNWVYPFWQMGTQQELWLGQKLVNEGRGASVQRVLLCQLREEGFPLRAAIFNPEAVQFFTVLVQPTLKCTGKLQMQACPGFSRLDTMRFAYQLLPNRQPQNGLSGLKQQQSINSYDADFGWLVLLHVLLAEATRMGHSAGRLWGWKLLDAPPRSGILILAVFWKAQLSPMWPPVLFLVSSYSGANTNYLNHKARHRFS